MKWRATIAITGVGGSLVIQSPSSAAYIGLAALLHTTAPINGINRDVYRVYALCSDPNDYITSVAGSPTLGNLTIRTFDPFGAGPGGNFVNPVGGSATAPTFYAVGTQLEWDTFVTIGLASVPYGGSDQTGLSPGFNGIPSVSTFTSNNAGWFTAGPQSQGLAGSGVQLPANFWGVMIMQLTVNASNGASGTVAIGGVNNNPLAGSTSFQTFANQTFTTHPPTPASLGLLAVAGLVGRSRRRL
jgi:MYXO-CTERM domain-containing protein